MRTDESAILFERAQRVLPGGVSSPVRAFRHVGGTPLFMRRGLGARIEDEDGNRFVDFCMSWGPLVLGHAHPAVVRAIADAAARGTTYGTPTRAEAELAELVTSLHPAAEKVRFCSSGTEAVMSAIRVARGATGRDLVVKLDGHYHGHADYLLVKAGSGLATAGQPDSAGVPAAIAGTCAALDPGDDGVAALEALMAARGKEVAAVIVEGVPANAGLLSLPTAFYRRARELCTEHGALLILDEVITGFRLGPGGASALHGVTPDLVTFGKVIGGGMPVGCYGGRAALLDLVAPLGPVYQAGTLSGNPVAMAAGKATLRALQDGGWARLEERAAALHALLEPVVREAPLPATLVRVGSIFWLVFQRLAPAAWSRVDRKGAERYRRLHRALLERGVYFPPSAYEVFFVSTEHDDEALAHTAKALREALAIAAAEAS